MIDELLKTKSWFTYKRIQGKAYFNHNQLYCIIKSFLTKNNISSLNWLIEFINKQKQEALKRNNENKRGQEGKLPTESQIINELLRKHLSVNEGLRTSLWNKINISFIQDILNNKVIETYQSWIKWDRTIEMFDVNMKVLSPSSYRKVLTYIEKKQGNWIEENKKFKFYYPIKSKVEPLDTIFNIVYKRQKWLCNGSWLPLSYDEATLHHKYVPRCIFVCNSLWNLEVLSQKEHEKKHKDPFAIVNILIKCYEYYSKLRKLK